MSITSDRLLLIEAPPATAATGSTVTSDAACPDGYIVLSGGCTFNGPGTTYRKFGPKEFPTVNKWGYSCAASGTNASPVIITTSVLCLDTTP